MFLLSMGLDQELRTNILIRYLAGEKIEKELSQLLLVLYGWMILLRSIEITIKEKVRC